MNDQRYPHNPDEPDRPEDTRRLDLDPPGGPAPYQPWGMPPPAEPRAPRGRGLGAAVLVGALVLGGAAGVGGAAAYDALDDSGRVGTGTTSDGPFESTRTAVIEDGTVEKVAATVLPSVVKINVAGQGATGSGSGVVLSEDGRILTNNHVVEPAVDGGTIAVNFHDGTTRKATVVGVDPLTDLAVIQAEDVDGLTPAALGSSDDLRVGQTVVAVGAPYGLNATVTSGIVSALNRPVSVSTGSQGSPFGEQGGALSTTYPAIQTDAAINPGNSGGPLVDMSGRVVGINSSIRTTSSGLSGDSGGSIGLGFAIPIDPALPIVNQLAEGEKATHARLGVSVSDVENGSLVTGALLREIEADGAADRAGLRSGDVITKVDDQAIDGSESLVATIRGYRPGESVEVTYVRDGRTETVTADLGSDANTTAS